MIILIIVEPLGFFEKDKIFLSLEKTKKRGSFGLQIRLKITSFLGKIQLSQQWWEFLNTPKLRLAVALFLTSDKELKIACQHESRNAYEHSLLVLFQTPHLLESCETSFLLQNLRFAPSHLETGEC